jgi:NAD(P)H-dependent flavin oxidoreductase YrpB (nitropropane dioxygenase family)
MTTAIGSFGGPRVSVRGVPSLLERLGVRLPVVQAGMGGGIAGSPLAASVSDAGGLGTIGLLPAPVLAREIAAVRARTAAPVAVNLLLPFARDAHFAAAQAADVVVTFWGRPRRRTAGVWIHQCGSVGEALAARSAGADAVIAQGVEAGGHVRGTQPALDLLERTRAALGPGYPVLLAGGIADAHDVRAALGAGAEAAVAGTRFVLADESGATPAYRERLIAAQDTVLTELFGLAWPAAPHRVVANAATRRWLGADARVPAWLRALNRGSAPLARLPTAAQAPMVRAQRASLPLLTPNPPARGTPERLLEAGPLYAGQTVARITDVAPAGELVRALAG